MAFKLMVKYLLVICFGRKSNLGHQTNCQGRYLYEVGKKKLFLQICGQHYLNIYYIYYIVYSSFISCKLQIYMSSNGRYTDITPTVSSRVGTPHPLFNITLFTFRLNSVFTTGTLFG